MMPSNYERAYAQAFVHGACYKLEGCGWRLQAIFITEKSVPVAWFLMNLDCIENSLWLTPLGWLARAEVSAEPTNNPKFTADPIYIDLEDGGLGLATFFNLKRIAEMALQVEDPTIMVVDNENVDLDVWGEVLS